MKKALIVAALAALASTQSMAFDHHYDGNYAQLEVGTSKSQFKALGETKNKNAFVGRIAYGYDFVDSRFQVDYTKFADAKFNNKGTDFESTAKITNHGIGVSYILTPFKQETFNPYIGARVSLNFLKGSATLKTATAQASTSKSNTQFGFGALAGVDVRVASKTYVNVGVYYDRLGKVDDVKVNNYGAVVGIRQTF